MAAGGGRWSNNNKGPVSGGGGGGGGQCSQCVTVINVCPSPHHTLVNNQQHQRRPVHQHSQQSSSDPPYENLSFHKVTINVPDVGEDVQHQHPDKQRVLLRKPPLRKSKVPLKYQGIKRVKSKSKTQKHPGHSSSTALDKSGYSQKEVWNWLYLEEAAKSNGLNIEPYDDGFLDDGSTQLADKSVSVQFSPVEFLQATNRLAHLNLEGFERFVGNTIDRALAGARAKSSDVLDAREAVEDSVIDSNTEVFVSEQDVYVGKDTHRDVSHVAPVSSTGCGCGKVSRAVCESCRGGESSGCSSALSSLESVKSVGPRSHDTDSSARGSYLSSEDYSRVVTPAPPHPEYSRVNKPSAASHEYMSPPAQTSHEYMRMGVSQNQKIYRGKIRSSLPVGGSSHKPYQTLEVSPEQGEIHQIHVKIILGFSSSRQDWCDDVDPGHVRRSRVARVESVSPC